MNEKSEMGRAKAEEYYENGGMDDAIDLLRDDPEFAHLFDTAGALDGRYEGAIHDAFHRAFTYEDQTGLSEDDLKRELADALSVLGD